MHHVMIIRSKGSLSWKGIGSKVAGATPSQKGGQAAFRATCAAKDVSSAHEEEHSAPALRESREPLPLALSSTST